MKFQVYKITHFTLVHLLEPSYENIPEGTLERVDGDEEMYLLQSC